ncbi:hypothetical protein RhiirA5_422822 [Rhizophagus irregularis]|uniref:DDE-1 domain-containing protein n=1 Tax=Rhizophagus irregularis TaxID=588596 RepID=A0A2N0PB55_9GLOM|nr:hypothetical protein RhiirA5_422822 [Rhizophagus irregularis]
MLDILKKPTMINLYENLINEFAFMKRHNLSWWRHIKVLQKLTSQTNELLKNFQEFVTHLRIEKLFEISNILNMDETPVWFDMTGNFTIDNRGEKTIHIRETGNEKTDSQDINLTVIPGGLTSICQPLDNVSINKPFKDNLRKEWHIWIAEGTPE